MMPTAVGNLPQLVWTASRRLDRTLSRLGSGQWQCLAPTNTLLAHVVLFMLEEYVMTHDESHIRPL